MAVLQYYHVCYVLQRCTLVTGADLNNVTLTLFHSITFYLIFKRCTLNALAMKLYTEKSQHSNSRHRNYINYITNIRFICELVGTSICYCGK